MLRGCALLSLHVAELGSHLDDLGSALLLTGRAKVAKGATFAAGAALGVEEGTWLARA